MKLFPLLALLAVFPLLAPAQDATPAPSAADSASGGSAKDAAATVPLPDQPAGPMLEKPMPLMPGEAPGISKPRSHRSHKGAVDASGSATPNPGNTFQAEEALKSRIRLRQLFTRVENDPALQDEWDAAHRAKTDPERRELLKGYYTHLYDRMLKLDHSMAERINARKNGALARLRYARLDPETDDAAEGTDSTLSAPDVPARP